MWIQCGGGLQFSVAALFLNIMNIGGISLNERISSDSSPCAKVRLCWRHLTRDSADKSRPGHWPPKPERSSSQSPGTFGSQLWISWLWNRHSFCWLMIVLIVCVTWVFRGLSPFQKRHLCNSFSKIWLSNYININYNMHHNYIDILHCITCVMWVICVCFFFSEAQGASGSPGFSACQAVEVYGLEVLHSELSVEVGSPRDADAEQLSNAQVLAGEMGWLSLSSRIIYNHL